jgi:hypothetical protein
MTRNRLIGAIAALAMLAVPAIASAHRSGDDHGRHHGRHHHAKKAKVKEVKGTVASFTAGELTLTLANGKSVSGLVTDRTRLKCHTAAPQSTTARAARHGDDDGDDDRKDDDVRGQGDDRKDDDVRGQDDNRKDDDDDDVRGRGDVNGNGACTTAALVAGAKVTEAKLSLKSTGAVWKKIELLK